MRREYIDWLNNYHFMQKKAFFVNSEMNDFYSLEYCLKGTSYIVTRVLKIFLWEFL